MRKTPVLSLLSTILLTVCVFIQQKQISNLTEGIERLNIAITTPGQVTRIDPTKEVSIKLINVEADPSSLEKNVFSTYRVSYFTGPREGADAQGYFGIGSATGIEPKRLLSCSHLFSEDPDITKYRLDIYNNEGTMINRIPFKLERISGVTDLSTLTVDQNLPYYTQLETPEEFAALKVTSPIYIVGAAAGAVPFHETEGRISAKSNEWFHELYQVSAPCIGGNSGGGVYDSKTGHLWGVLVRGGGTISLAVPLTTILSFLK